MRKTAIFVAAGLFALALVIQLLERAVPPSAAQATQSAAEALAELRPTLEREDDSTIFIGRGLLDNARYSFGSDRTKEEVDGIYACLEQGIEEEFGAEGTFSRSGFPSSPFARRRVVKEALQPIQLRCIRDIAAIPPIPPIPPQAEPTAEDP
jgi:hypothetical protein